MSSTTNTPYMTKSMNGVIVISDGAGVVIENGVITAPTIDLTNLNINEIQGIAPANNILLYTDTTGSIDIGQLSTSTLNLKSINTNINASTLNLSSNVLKIAGAQEIQQANTSTVFLIGSNITDRNMYLGNNNFCPQVPCVATSAFDVVNYDTCNALIAAGGGSSTISVDDILSFSPSSFVNLWTDNIAGILIGSPNMSNTITQSMGSNNGLSTFGTNTGRTADILLGTGRLSSANVYLGSGADYTGNVYIASNNYQGPSGITTAKVYIGGTSTNTRFNGQVQIAAYNPAAGTNIVNIGSDKTVNTIQGSTLYLNNTNGASNIVYVGGSNTTTTDIRAATVNLNSNFLVAGNTTNIGNNLATIEAKALTMNLNSNNVSVNTINLGGSVSIINSYPISPNTGITYDGTNGTNIAGAIGNVYNGSFTGGSLPNSSLQTIGNINSLPKGVYMVTGSFCFNCAVAAQVSYQQAQITKNSNSESVAMMGICTGTAAGNSAVRNYFLNVSGIVSLTATDGLTATLFLQFTGAGTFTRSGNSFQFRAVRIA